MIISHEVSPSNRRSSMAEFSNERPMTNTRNSINDFLTSFRIREDKIRRGSVFVRQDSIEKKEMAPSTKTILKDEILEERPSDESKSNLPESFKVFSPKLSTTAKKNNFTHYLTKQESGISKISRKMLKSKYIKLFTRLYLSKQFNAMVLMFTILNISAFVIDDNSHRIDKRQIYGFNEAFYIEIVCCVFFTFSLLFKVSIIYATKKSWKLAIMNFRTILTFTILLVSWIDIFAWKQDNQLLRSIKRLRVLTIVTIFSKLRMTLFNLIASFPALGKNYLTILLLMVLYAIAGMHLFGGTLENRCRATEYPVNGTWPIAQNVPVFLCGSWQCPNGTYCGNPLDYDLPLNSTEFDVIQLNFGITNFNSIFSSLLSVYHFMDSTGWSGITYTYWRTINSFVTAFFFVSLMVIGAYIMVNVLLATLYEEYSYQKKIIKDEAKSAESKKTLKRMQPTTLKRPSIVQGGNEINLTQLKSVKKVKSANSALNPTQRKVRPRAMRMSVEGTQIMNFNFLAKKSMKTYLYNILNHDIFKFLVNVLVIVNGVILCMDRYPISPNEELILEVMDFLFYLFFFAELHTKIYAFGWKIYYSKKTNWVEFAIIEINALHYLFELMLGINPINGQKIISTDFIRGLKLARIFIIFYSTTYAKSLRIIIRAFSFTIYKVRRVFLLIAIILLTMAFIGMDLFAYKVRYLDNFEIPLTLNDPNAKPPRVYFDNIMESMVAVTMSILNEEWHVAMYLHYRMVGFEALLFYLFMNACVQIILMAWFKAVFINKYIKYIREYLIENYKESASSNPISEKIQKLNFIFVNSFNFISGAKVYPVVAPEQNPSGPRMQIQRRNRRKSFILSSYISTAKFREIMAKKMSQKAMDYFFTAVVIFYMIITGIDSPLYGPHHPISHIMANLDYFFAIVYFLNIFLGVYVDGKKFFKHDIYNLIEFFNMVVSVACILWDKYDYPILHLLKILRCVRLWKFVRMRNSELRIISKVLWQSMPNIFRLIFFFGIFLLFFSIFATKYLKGILYYCTSLPDSELAKVVTKNDCFDLGGDWINYDINFDNALQSVGALFEVSTSEAWSEILWRTTDSVKLNRHPRRNNNRTWILFFFLFFLIGNTLLYNMIIGVISETVNFNREKEKKINHLTEEQKEWYRIKTSILSTKPKLKVKPSQNKVLAWIYKLIHSKYFKRCTSLLSLGNIIVLMSYSHRQSQSEENILDALNLTYIIILNLEVVLKILGLRYFFPNKKKNFFDLAIAVFSDIVWIVFPHHYNSLNQIPRIFHTFIKALQVTRIYSVVHKIKGVKKLIVTLFNILPSLTIIFFMMFMILYFYTTVGMYLFGYLMPQVIVNDYDIHFKTFSTAMFSLIRIATGEAWFTIVSDCVRRRQPNFACVDIKSYPEYLKYGLKGCGSTVGYLYFFSFHVIFSMILFNLLIALIINAYSEQFKAEMSAVNRYQLGDIKKLWMNYDPNAYGYINYKDFWKFSSEIAIIFGVKQEELLDISNKKVFLKTLSIPIYENNRDQLFCYKFHDVIIAMSKISVTLKFGNLLEEEDSISLGEEESKNSIFKLTTLTSGDMASIIIIQQKLRVWIKKGRSRCYGTVLNEVDLATDIGSLLKGVLHLKKAKDREKEEASRRKALVNPRRASQTNLNVIEEENDIDCSPRKNKINV